jgi:peptidyl-prolyl cis-trans isomerase B (cyclophilin B)
MSIRTSILTSVIVFTVGIFLSSCQEPAPKQTHISAPSQKESKEKAARKKEPSSTVLNDATFQSVLKAVIDTLEHKYFTISTPKGEIVIELYDNTPWHRANFAFLVNKDYFDGTWFHRVSAGHVIQAGNNDEAKTAQLRQTIGEYTLPAEALDQNWHLRGTVAAARSYSNNPTKRSDPYEFYINLGSNFSLGQLRAMEEQYNIDLTADQLEQYQKVGGAPHLDGEHTVFGRVVSGMQVVEAISKVPVDEGEWPLENIPIKISFGK